MQIKLSPPRNDTAADWSAYLRELDNDKENTARKDASLQVVNYYKNKQLSYLEAALRRIYTDPHSYHMKRKWTQNITKQVVDALAQCYACKVKRSVPKLGKKAAKTLDQKVFQGINKKMRNANKWLVLERSTLLYARWNAKQQRIDYRSYHQFEFDVVVDPGSTEQELMAVILSDFKSFEDSNIVIYTRNNTYWFKGDKLQRQIVHDLDILPFVLMHSEDPGFEDYLDPDTQLVNSNLEINIAISNLLNIHQNQAHAVPVLTLPAEMPLAGIDDGNPNIGTQTQVETDRRLDIDDPDKALVLTQGDAGEQPDFKYVQPNADFSGSIEAIRYIVNSLAQTYGVDTGIFNIEVSGNPATVFHVNEKRREAMVGDLQSVFEDAEKELFDSAYKLARMSDPTIPTVEPVDFMIEFTSDASIIDQLKSSDVVKLNDSGLIDELEVVRHHYGDKSRPEAEAFIQEMLEAQKRVNDMRDEILGPPEPAPIPVAPESPEEEKPEENQEVPEEE